MKELILFVYTMLVEIFLFLCLVGAIFGGLHIASGFGEGIRYSILGVAGGIIVAAFITAPFIILIDIRNSIKNIEKHSQLTTKDQDNEVKENK